MLCARYCIYTTVQLLQRLAHNRWWLWRKSACEVGIQFKGKLCLPPGHYACTERRKTEYKLVLASAWHITDGGWSALNLEKSEDRLSENVEGVKEAKIVKARDTMDVALYCWRSQRPA